MRIATTAEIEKPKVCNNKETFEKNKTVKKIKAKNFKASD